jgi:hypothetical protein
MMALLFGHGQVWWTGEGTQPNQHPPRLVGTTTFARSAGNTNGPIIGSCPLCDHGNCLCCLRTSPDQKLLCHAAIAVGSIYISLMECTMLQRSCAIALLGAKFTMNVVVDQEEGVQ